MKINKEQLDMLKEIMALSFSAVELNLYLDTHPFDQRALSLHNSYDSKIKDLEERYHESFTCLTHACQSKCPWEWIEEPWPWEINYEMGGK